MSKTESPTASGVAHGSALKPWQYQCSKCEKIISFDRRGKARGWCSACEVATWTPEKTKAVGRLIGAALRGENDRLPSLVTDALKHCAPNSPDQPKKSGANG